MFHILIWLWFFYQTGIYNVQLSPYGSNLLIAFRREDPARFYETGPFSFTQMNLQEGRMSVVKESLNPIFYFIAKDSFSRRNRMEANFLADTQTGSHRTHTHTPTHTHPPNLTGETAVEPLQTFKTLNSFAQPANL